MRVEKFVQQFHQFQYEFLGQFDQWHNISRIAAHQLDTNFDYFPDTRNYRIHEKNARFEGWRLLYAEYC